MSLPPSSNRYDETKKQAKQFAARLLGYYPRQVASDPEVFTTGLVQLLMAYPADLVEASLSPISGIPAKHKFIPSIAEVSEWLQEHKTSANKSFSDHAAAQLSERKRLDAILLPPPPRVPFKQQLMETFKIRDVPHGIDTCALIQLRARYGYNEQGFQDHIEKMLNGK